MKDFILFIMDSNALFIFVTVTTITTTANPKYAC